METSVHQEEEIETAGASRGPAGRGKTRPVLTGVAVVLLLFAVSAAFADYRGLLSRLSYAIWPIDPGDVEVDAQTFRGYFAVEKKGLTDDGQGLLLTIRRADTFPLKDAEFQDAAARSGDSIRALLALEAVARGYVRCECFDEQKAFLGATVERIADLRDKEAIELILRIPEARRLRRITITY